MLKVTMLNATTLLLIIVAAGMVAPRSIVLSGLLLAAAMVVFAVFMVKSKGRTLWEWRKLAQHRKTTARADALLFAMDKKAVTWDGNRICMFLELTYSPFHLVSWKPSTQEGIPEIPYDTIADALRQYDITLDHISVISHGYRVESRAHPFNQVYEETAAKGQYSRFRTIIEVSIRLADAMNAIDSRRGPEDGPEVGAARTVNVATQRLMRSLIDEGWAVKPVSHAQLTSFDNEISSRVGDAFESEMSKVMGTEKRVQIYSIDDIEIHPEELSPTADSVTLMHVLRPEGVTRVKVDSYVMLTGVDEDDTEVARGYTVETGVQGDLLSQMLPLAPYIDTLRLNTVSYSHPTELPRVGQAVGTGIYLGTRYKRKTEHLFMSLSGAYGSVIHVSGYRLFVLSLVTRMIAAGEKVDILLSDPDGAWEKWAKYFGSNNVRVGKKPSRSATVRVVDSTSGATPVKGVITIVVCADRVSPTAKYSITSVGKNVFNVKTPEDGISSVSLTASKKETVWYNPTRSVVKA